MSTKKMDQKEYLKKYLSGDKTKKKKKDKKHKHKAATVVIIDDDCTGTNSANQIDEELLLTGDDAPQIVGECVEEMMNGEKASKWRSITVKEEIEDTDVKVKQEAPDLWGKRGAAQAKDEFTPPKKEKSHNRALTPSQTLSLSPARRRDGGKSRRQRKSSSDRENSHTPPRRHGVSPGRRSRQSSSDQSPPRRRNGRDSPPRKRTASPTTRSRMSPADQSPRRRQRHQSPSRRQRRDSSDLSPPRKRGHSPARRRGNSSSDQSPPRRRDSDQSPPRRRAQSPTRHRGNRSPDRSLPRRRDTPPRRRENSSPGHSAHSAAHIKQEALTPDRSPSRKREIKVERPSPPPRRSRWGKPEPANSPSPPPTHKPKTTKTLDGKKAGLQDAHSLKVETEERRREEERMYAKMSKDVSGRDAEVQVRSTGRRGKRAREAEAEDPEVQRQKAEHELKKKQLYDRWGKGLKQVEDHQLLRAEQEYEGSKPLARYSDDEDLDRHLREQERADDPMLQYMRQKHQERQKEARVPTVPVYQGSYPENRFGIRPGYRWDGVDRSSGYEKKWFDVQNEKRAMQEDAYKYSVEDM